MKSFKQFCKENVVPVNAVSGGGVEGIGFGPKGEPGGRRVIFKKMLKRKLPYVASKLPT